MKFINNVKAHVYVKGAMEAVKMYKEAFGLDSKEKELILDDSGNVWHCVLTRNGDEYISISEKIYLHKELIRDYPEPIHPVV